MMNTRSIKLIVIFIEVIIVVCSCIYIIRYTNDNKIASLDSWIDEVITDRRSKKDGFFVTDNGYPIDREVYVNLSYIYSDEELKTMDDKTIARKELSCAFLYNEFFYKDDIEKYKSFSVNNGFKNVKAVRRMTRNRAVELAVKEVNYEGDDIKVYYDDIDDVFKNVLTEGEYAYLVYCDTEGVTLNVYKVPKTELM